MKEVSGGQDYKTLSTELDAALLEARKALKPFIVRGMELERDYLRRNIMKTLAAALPAMAELLLAYVDGESYGKHTLVHDFLTLHRDEVVSYLGTSGQDFLAIYYEVNNLDAMPPTAAFNAPTQAGQAGQAPVVTPQAATGPAAMNVDGTDLEILEETTGEGTPVQNDPLSQQPETEEAPDASQQNINPETPIPNAPRFRAIINGHETCLTHLQVLIAAFAQAKEIYHRRITENAMQARIAKVIGTQEKSKTTDSTAEILEGEDNVPPKVLKSLTDQRIEAKNKPIRQDVATMKSDNKKLNDTVKRLEKELKELKSKKESGRAVGGAAKTNQITPSPRQPSTPRRGRGRRAAGRGDASQTRSSGRGSSRSRSKSPSKRRGRRNGRGKSKPRSNQS